MAIRLTGISKRYGGTLRPAVDGIDLHVQDGEIVSLLGPSGCGKTTTLRVIAGFERADAGTVTIGGQTVDGNGRWVAPEHRGVGMVFQDYALFPHLTVRGNVAFGLHRVDRRFARTRVDEVLQLVGLANYGNRYPYQLSGGQQQRVALARALAPRPHVLLMDEPFSNLDPHLRDQMRRDVVEIVRSAAITTIFVTHDQRDALAISDRIAVMNQGCIEQFDRPTEIYQRPCSCFVATFVGKSNVLPGQVCSDCGLIASGACFLPCPKNIRAEAGAPVMLSVRPESFRLDPEGPLVATVMSAFYLGDAIEATVNLGAGDVKVPVNIRLAPDCQIYPGEQIRLSVDSELVSVVEPSGFGLQVVDPPVLTPGARAAVTFPA